MPRLRDDHHASLNHGQQGLISTYDHHFWAYHWFRRSKAGPSATDCALLLALLRRLPAHDEAAAPAMIDGRWGDRIP